MSKPTYRVEEVATAFSCEPVQDEIVSALSERDFRIFEVEQPKDAMVPYHTHDEEEKLIVLGGRMQFNVEEELVLLEEGEMITIREGAIHAAAPVDGKPAKLLIAFGGGGETESDNEGWDDDEGEDFGHNA
jgi:quercetin dioxygenase-like cupin family protein